MSAKHLHLELVTDPAELKEGEEYFCMKQDLDGRHYFYTHKQDAKCQYFDGRPIEEYSAVYRVVPPPKTVKDILVAAIKAAGGDGLYNKNGACGCGVDDLAPCDCFKSNCVIAKLKNPVGFEHGTCEICEFKYDCDGCYQPLKEAGKCLSKITKIRALDLWRLEHSSTNTRTRRTNELSRNRQRPCDFLRACGATI